MKRSFVWLHFKEVNEKTAICNHCSKNLTVSGGSTSGLKAHLLKQHSLTENSAIPSSSKQPKIDVNATKVPVILFLLNFLKSTN